jgi:hypothetical protein
MVRWETLFGTTTATSDVTIPTGTQVVLHGCAQLNSTVNVRSVRVPAGATVRVVTALGGHGGLLHTLAGGQGGQMSTRVRSSNVPAGP